MTLETISHATAADMLGVMADMQAEHNAQVHPDWRTQDHPYYRAIWVECAEMLDHYGWKWWKAQQPDLDQVRLELVDIWHFGLSELLRAETSPTAVVEAFDVRGERADPAALRGSIERLAAATLVQQAFGLAEFVGVMNALPMTYAELFELYIGKNVLNRFRQDHGYQDGSYRKVWAGQEDNEHLMVLRRELSVHAPDYVTALYARLEARYRETK